MKVLHDWLRDYLGDSTPETVDIERLFTFHSFEIEGVDAVDGHTVIDVKVLPDRSSDCLSHRGVARELAALLGKPLVHDPLLSDASLEPKTDRLTLTIENPHVCRRFTGALIEGVRVEESPEWLQSRLRALGQRPINNIVDATNYVMFAIGQPLHAYDATKLGGRDGQWDLGVRMARDGEEITTLSNDTCTLTSLMALIVDRSTDSPVSIAGVKGGKHAEVDVTTTTVILEAANFDPQVVRRTAQTLRLQTDASKRFENDLVPELASYGMREVVALILQIAGGKCVGYADTFPVPYEHRAVSVSEEKVCGLLGLTLTQGDIELVLTNLGFSFTRTDNGWDVTPPFVRTDVQIPEDVIAEIGRVYGYEHVTSVMPPVVPLTEVNARYYYSERIRQFLKERGFSEIITSSFRKRDTICLRNALASDKGCLRSTLTPNVSEALDRNMPNVDLLRLRQVELFEIGTVFTKPADGVGVGEYTSLAIGVRMKQTGPTPKDDARVLEVVTELEGDLGVSLNATVAHGVAECNLTDVVQVLKEPTSYDHDVPTSLVTYEPFSSYPFVSRDIALWAPESATSSMVEAVIREIGTDLLRHTTLFDEFHKDGQISYAYRLVFQSYERTLTDDEVGGIMHKITETLTSKGFTVR